MYNSGDFVVYKKNVCRVREIKHNNINNKDYYILVPIDDESLIIDVPVDNKLGFIRDVISKSEAERIIDNIKNIDVLDNINDKNIELTYKDLIYNGNQEDLIKIIKTTYLRNKKREDDKKKKSDKDSRYFEMAERYLYNELSIALNMTQSEVKNYIVNKMENKD